MESQPPQAKLPDIDEEHENVIKLLEECLEKHDGNRKIVQGKLAEILNKLTEQIGGLEDRINRELCGKFISEEDRLQAALNELRGNSTDSAFQKAKVELHTIQSYEIILNKKGKNDLTILYELKTERRTVPEDGSVGLAISEVDSSIHNHSNATDMSEIPCDSAEFAEERERLIELLKERLEEHDSNRKTAQDKLHEICEGMRTQIYELEERINKELEEKFIFEDNRLQAALDELRGNRTVSALQKAKAELLVEQSYDIIENKKEEEADDDDDEVEEGADKEDEDEDEDDEEENEYEDENDSVEPNFDLTTLYELKAERQIIPELMEMRKPTNIRVTGVNRGRVSVQFTCLNPDEERVLSDKDIVNPVKYKCLLFKKGTEQESKEEYSLDKDEGNDSSPSFTTFTPDILEAETPYEIRVKMAIGNRESEWSDDISEFTTSGFKECCAWKKCPGDVDDDKKYSVDGVNPRIATKINNWDYCTIIGNTRVPLNTVTSWNIKVLKSMDNNGDDIHIGIAPSDTNQNGINYDCGWYFDCYSSTLWSGPPHNYNDREYGPRKEWNEKYVHTGDSVGVVMDTTKGDLSFVLNGVNLGVAYGGIPLDKPLVPCVILWNKGDSIELDLSGVKENVDSSIPVPSNVTIKRGITWDSITLTWDEVKDASFYQIEVDGSISCGIVTTNSFTKRGLLPETEHSFRVRTVRGSSVGEWSDVVEGRTLKESFETGWWKECPDYVDDNRKYSVDGVNPRIATKINNWDYCTIIGSTRVPPSKVISWSIKILESRYNDGCDIYIGIAPNDINQNVDNYDKCGWYFYCYYSTLWSGPPHNYYRREYGPRKEWNEKYVHTGGSVGVVMDTTKGDLSFVLNGVNLGLAYEGIPLDKPLVPCVILKYKGDSVELDISEVKENDVDSSIPAPSNITAKNRTWDTITLTWDEVTDASFYQIEVDGSNSGDASTTNSFTKRGLLPETEHNFRVRTVRGSSVSEWSGVVVRRTLKAPEFSECVWKECPDGVDDDRKYSVDGGNPRVATKINSNGRYCTIIGNTPIPYNSVTSWSIKVLKSRGNNGDRIHIGIAPSDINQNVDNYDTCGWYFNCYDSRLYSGPPHNYGGKAYGPRKEKDGQYVHTGDNVGVVMDTTKGELSFVLNGVNHGVAHCGIPLDNPLVPCVILWNEDDSVELII